MNTEQGKKTLHLTLKKKWFDLISSGEKKEEYREIKQYWADRLFYSAMHDHVGHNRVLINGWYMTPLPITHIAFRNGYQKNAPSMTVELKAISVGTAKPEWSDNWQGDVFVIKIGDIISKSF